MTAALLVPGAGAVADRRCRVALAGCLSLLLICGGLLSGTLATRRNAPVPDLHAVTVALDGSGAVVEVSESGRLIPGTRVLADSPASVVQAAAQLAWLAAGRVPHVEGVPDDLVKGALLDLYVLSRSPSGVPVAGWSPSWRYVWPRDSALAAVALARTGHPGDAERVLSFLQQMQPASGLLQARYRPDGSGVPDARAPQLDGVGWALWAVRSVADARPAPERVELVRRFRPLIDRSTAAARRAVAGRSALPPPSPDYWEVGERRTTLATAALLAAGLDAAADLYAELGEPVAAAVADDAGRTRRAIERRFSPAYPRHLDGVAGSTDLGVDFLLPPFAPAGVHPDAVRAWRASTVLMLRPAGGLAPGSSWRRDGISWTNVTATRAMVAACTGDDEQARSWLGWLAAHRTAAGSLPEKVLADGRPASVAPLAWTAAAVLIAADRLTVS